MSFSVNISSINEFCSSSFKFFLVISSFSQVVTGLQVGSSDGPKLLKGDWARSLRFHFQKLFVNKMKFQCFMGIRGSCQELDRFDFDNFYEV